MSISSEITSIGENLKKDYQAIANLGADLTNVDKNIENIAELLDGVYDNLPKTEYQEGTEINLGVTSKGKLDYENGVVGIGQTEQDGTPTPSTPITINSVTGNQDVVVSGINEINVEYPTTTAYGVTCTNNGNGTYAFNGTAERDLYFDICYFTLPVGTHKLVGCPSGGSWNNYIQYIRREDGQPFSINDSGSGGTGEVVGNEGQLRLSIMIKSGYACNNLLFKPMVTKDTSLTYNDYEPYITPITKQLSLGDIELAQIGNYKDYIFKNLTNNKWYKHSEVGKKNIADSNAWEDYSSIWGNCSYAITKNIFEKQPIAWSDMYSKYFKAYTVAQVKSLNNEIVVDNSSLVVNNQNTATLAEFKTWLSSNNFYLYYQLATPQDIEITDQTLISQLNAWYNAHSNNGTTIITSNGNLPMIIKVRGLKGE